jgi:hypothetical protein
MDHPKALDLKYNACPLRHGGIWTLCAATAIDTQCMDLGNKLEEAKLFWRALLWMDSISQDWTLTDSISQDLIWMDG